MDSPIRALFLDIDGTLISGNEIVSSEVLQSIRKAKDYGVEVVLCTGRTMFTTRHIAAQLPEPIGYVVTCNGAVAMHVNTGETLVREVIPIPIALHIIRVIFNAGATPYVFEDSIGSGFEAARVLHPPGMHLGHFAEAPRYRPYTNILHTLPFEPCSVSTFGPTELIRPLVQSIKYQLPDAVRVIQSGSNSDWGIEVFSAGVSKQLGLESIAKRLALQRHQIMAIGDHINDIEMLQWAGVGVAMGNALPEIKAVADWVTSSVSDHGVASAIERFILSPDVETKHLLTTSIR